MRHRILWLGVVAALLSGAQTASAGGYGEHKSEAAKSADKQGAWQKHSEEKAAKHQQWQAEETRRQQENTQKAIGEAEREVQQLTEKLAGGEAGPMQPLLAKKLEFATQHLTLLKQEKNAWDAGNAEQAKTLASQRREVCEAWWGYGETAARVEAERAKWKTAADSVSPEVKTAWTALDKSYDDLLRKMELRASLEKEIRALKKEQEQASEKLNQLHQSSQKQKRDTVK